MIGGILGVIGGILAAFYTEYRENRDWCWDTRDVLNDISNTAAAIRVEDRHPKELLEDAKRLEELTSEIPPYHRRARHPLEELQHEVHDLATMDIGGPPGQLPEDYDYEDEPDEYGDISYRDYIADQADMISERAYQINSQFSCGIMQYLLKVARYNLLPRRLR